MYITQIKLDLNNRLLYKDLTNLHRYHGYLESAFPAEQLLNVRKRHLWRLENQTILLVSEDEPDHEVLNKYGNSQSKNYDKFLNNLSTKRMYRFELVANPLQRDKRKRIPCNDNKQRIDWLRNQSEYHGFKLQDVRIKKVKKYHIDHHDFTVKTVDFVGYLEIIDLPKFKKALVNGIGREKAYGCGLLTVM